MFNIDYDEFHSLTVYIPTLKQTGFWVTYQTIITCAHGSDVVINKGANIDIMQNDMTFATEVTHVDTDNDILILKARNNLDPSINIIPLGKDVMPRDQLYSWGYTNRHSDGGESLGVEMEGWSRAPYLLKLSKGMVEPGMSGSPLYSYRTNTIVGMIRATRDRNAPSGGRAVPSSTIIDECENEGIFSTSNLDPSIVLKSDIPTILGMFESAYESAKPILPIEKELLMGNIEQWTEADDMLDELQRHNRHDETRRESVYRWYKQNPRTLRFIVSKDGDSYQRVGVTSILPLHADSYRSYRAGLTREFDFSERDIVQASDGGKSSWLCFQSFAISSKFTRQTRKQLRQSFISHVDEMSLGSRKPRIIAEIGTNAGLIEAKSFGLKYVGLSADRRPLFEIDTESTQV